LAGRPDPELNHPLLESEQLGVPLKVNPVRNSSGALNPAGIILKSDNHIKGTSEHTKRMDLMICLGKKPNPTQEVPYETIIRGFRSAWQQQFDGNY